MTMDDEGTGMKRVHVIAHRGFSGLFPENTEIAFTRALALGVDMIELDVHLSKDHALIVIHDPTVDRTSNGSGRVADMTLQDLKRLDAGSWMDAAFRGASFLTLDEAFEVVGRRTRLNVHVKAYDADRSLLVPLVVHTLKRHDLLDNAFIASDEASIVMAKRTEPALAVCNLSTVPQETYIARSVAAGSTILQPGNRQVDRAFVAEAHKQGLEVNPFYADDEAEMRRLIACGVDGILTNRPDRLIVLAGQ